VLKSPGLLRKHYAPKARLLVREWSDETGLREHASALGVPLSRVHVIAHTHIPSGAGFGRVSVIPHDAEAFARAIYAELHVCDALGAETILVEALPGTSQWRAIADRLARAAA
jgi:L-threonylcarbamoyladenylate synthase